ncbi:hypothetical protein EDD22DRAFT_173526 [Suillus occidentalis]|nr:hypothetical protein EDD22DRAFT_173526 [Suillus occidentalis]
MMNPSTMDNETYRLCASRTPAAACSVLTFIMIRVDLIGWPTIYSDSRFEYHQSTHLLDCHHMKLQKSRHLQVQAWFMYVLVTCMRKFSVRNCT